MGKLWVLSPIFSVPVLMLAPVFASMIVSSMSDSRMVGRARPEFGLKQHKSARFTRHYWRSATSCALQDNCKIIAYDRGGRSLPGKICASGVPRHRGFTRCPIARLEPPAVPPDRQAAPGFLPCRARRSTSKIPGEVVRPVSAARNGCATAPSLAPRCSAKPRTACSVASAVQGSTSASSAGDVADQVARLRGE